MKINECRTPTNYTIYGEDVLQGGQIQRRQPDDTL